MSDETARQRRNREAAEQAVANGALGEFADDVADDLRAADRQIARLREALGRYMSGEDSRAQVLRLKMFQMRDAREAVSAAGFTLTTEAKARLYDMQQDIIRAAIAADDSALQEAAEGSVGKGKAQALNPSPGTAKGEP